MAETTKKTATKKATTKSTISTDVTVKRDVEIELLKEQNEMLRAQLEELKAQKSRPQVVTVSADTEKVFFMWQAPVSDDNVVTFGDNGMYGRIVGKVGTFYVPKTDISRIMDTMTRGFIDKRWLIVLSGLDENEREAYGVNYKEGEVLDKGAFAKLVEMGEGILDIYPKLCKGHKEIVAKCFYESFVEGKHIKRDVVVSLNKLDSNDAFRAIIEEMNKRELEA